ncbi:hypothetical protein [Catenulispora pinisilvae]|uniref:hypothetical protein n=1 Tax=Catenulispora pinisilvae TaxID=2705253 RepID=UPI001890EEBE|nr:hypothetical protein [Catenulispora pinisilvae]
MGDPTTTMVANPRIQYLQAAQAALAKYEPDIRAALDSTVSAMTGGSVWTGSPQASNFTTDVQGGQGTLRTNYDNLVTDVTNALRSEPAQVTLQEAQAWQRQRRLDRY